MDGKSFNGTYKLIDLTARSVGGYFSSRAYVTLGGVNRKKNALLTATALPTLVPSVLCRYLFTVINRLIFGIVLFLNFFLLAAGSSGAVPFGKFIPPFFRIYHDDWNPGTMLTIIALWFGISAPLSAVGSFFGSKQGVSIISLVSLPLYAILFDRPYQILSGQIRFHAKSPMVPDTYNHGCE